MDPRQVTLRRILGGVALILAPFFNWVAALLSPIAAESSAAGQLDAVSGHAARATASGMLDVIAVVFFIPAVFALCHLVAPRAFKLGHVATAMTVAGLVGFTGIAVLGIVQAEMVVSSADREQMVALYERFENSAGFGMLGAMFLLGQVIGFFLFAVALLKTKVVPFWVPLLVLVFLVWDVGCGIAGVDPQIAGAIDPHMLGFIALGCVGLTVLRSSDASWASMVAAPLPLPAEVEA